MKKVKLFYLITVSMLSFIKINGQQFDTSIESLSQYECPEWFKDAKFGIYCHWNAQTASKSANNGWYARDMYMQGSGAYNDHLKNWGHPSEVGYKDIIEAWNGDKFNAEQWVELFKDAGAKYIITMANHHDNFDMWDSKHQPRWNSLNYGPKIDVCAEMRRETLKAGLRWGVTTHVSRAYSWWQVNKDHDKTGDKKGVPYDGNNPEFSDLYFTKAKNRAALGGAYYELRAPLASPEEYKENWKNRMFDLIDRYHPDHFYFDAAVPFMDNMGETGLEVISHYYNHNAERHGGKNQGVMVFKEIPYHGIFYKDIATEVMERQFSGSIEDKPKQTDNSIGPWFYTGNSNFNSKEKAKSIIHDLVDVVSKNNNLLLNIPPKADGSFDEKTIQTLKIIGTWLKVNGEAIYATRPWHIYGEGQIRYTTRKKTLYAIMLNQPSHVIKACREWTKNDILKIERLDGGKVSWKLTDQGLKITSSNKSPQNAYVFKIECRKEISDLPVFIEKRKESQKGKDQMEEFGFDGNKKNN
ncbi:alpha-L-fucosidase [Aureibaculum sp. 2210JD6-5]|uniref:alpha-L-fucosidase n=1 Tax=Aureibaculum sp. 2210JD6-5 TaxID=3103957 RepID=UPI002AAE4870|nr:alpha-L-fucosidase [Aureibaculum sp. 2210JD6-5]MDY7396898.1 alpha-L-fucosidase [Aureibaculum sp. 2210JD6-5]